MSEIKVTKKDLLKLFKDIRNVQVEAALGIGWRILALGFEAYADAIERAPVSGNSEEERLAARATLEWVASDMRKTAGEILLNMKRSRT